MINKGYYTNYSYIGILDNNKKMEFVSDEEYFEYVNDKKDEKMRDYKSDDRKPC